MADSKRCVACEVVKPLFMYYRNKKAPDGLYTWCKECWGKRGEMLKEIAARKHKCSICGDEKARENFRWNPKFGVRTECKECEKTLARCTRCSAVKPLEEFPPSKRMQTGRHGMCSACHSARTLERYHTNAEVRENHKKYSRSERAVAWRKQYKSQPSVKDREKRRHSTLTRWMYHNDPIYRLKVKARTAVGHALKTGRIVKPDTCQSNGKYGVACDGRLEAHHHRGYWPRAAWTDVEWLCVACHKKADELAEKEFRIVVRDDSNPIYTAMAKKVDDACELLGIDEESLFAATLECAGEDECDTFLKAINWLKINGYVLQKEMT